MYQSIQAYLRAAGSIGREADQIGPFLATVTAETDNPYLNYAIPDDAAEPTWRDISALVAHYRDRDRIARLEYVDARAPKVEAALMASGFTVEGRLPLMVTTAQAVGISAPPAEVAVEIPSTQDDVAELVTVLAAAYGDPLPTVDDVRRRHKAIVGGAIALVVRDVTTGTIVGGGGCSRILDGVTEVTGIGVAPSHRRRGIAQVLVAGLARTALDRGAVSPFLMAAHEREAAIYRRAGFSQIGAVLHISLP
jgi:predicted GNAT family acetyltransferase